MPNPIIEQMQNFRSQGVAFEPSYTFAPGPEFRTLIDQLPDGKCLFSAIDQSGDVRFSPLDTPVPGYRVRVGHCFVYLSVFDDLARVRAAQLQAARLHATLLHSRVYFPEHADILDYWRRPEDELNGAEHYGDPVAFSRSRYLSRLIRERCPDVTSAIEIGCNVGRNLFQLHADLGLTVAGIEVCDQALARQRDMFPQIDGSAFYRGTAQAIVPTLADDSYDVVFSMAVLMHLHPETDDQFWAEIVRVARRFVVTIENESTTSDRNWSRNYRELFEPHGAREIFSERLAYVDADIDGYIARVLRTRPVANDSR